MILSKKRPSQSLQNSIGGDQGSVDVKFPTRQNNSNLTSHKDWRKNVIKLVTRGQQAAIQVMHDGGCCTNAS